MNPKPHLDASHTETSVPTANTAPGIRTTGIISHQTRENVTGTTHTTRTLTRRNRRNTSTGAGSPNTAMTMGISNQVNTLIFTRGAHRTRINRSRNRKNRSTVHGRSRNRKNPSTVHGRSRNRKNPSTVHGRSTTTRPMSTRNRVNRFILPGVPGTKRNILARNLITTLSFLTVAIPMFHHSPQGGSTPIITDLHRGVHRRMNLLTVHIVGTTENRAGRTGDKGPGNMVNGTIRTAVSLLTTRVMATRQQPSVGISLKNLRAGGCDLRADFVRSVVFSSLLFLRVFFLTEYTLVSLLLLVFFFFFFFSFSQQVFLGGACFRLLFVCSQCAACI
jgi:hypothetical protein